MLQQPFYHQLLRRYHAAIGAIFNEVTILRNAGVENQGPEVQRLVVPIEYSARESMFPKRETDRDLNVRTAMVVPRLAYEMTSMRYDSARRLNPLGARTFASGQTLMRYLVPTPYILVYSLYALTRSIEDANQIVEQIVPYFAPDYTAVLRLLPSLGIVDRLRLVMEPGSPQWVDSYEQASYDTTRDIVVTFTFAVQATFYGPVPTAPDNVIRSVMVDLYGGPLVAGSGTLSCPDWLVVDGFGRLMTEDGGAFVLEDNTSVVGRISPDVSVVIEPDPYDHPNQRPVPLTVTTTEYADGVPVTVTVRPDVLE